MNNTTISAPITRPNTTSITSLYIHPQIATLIFSFLLLPFDFRVSPPTPTPPHSTPTPTPHPASVQDSSVRLFSSKSTLQDFILHNFQSNTCHDLGLCLDLHLCFAPNSDVDFASGLRSRLLYGI
ncbi:hypothetical protein CCACVL1_12359 [Corchorus capsularis]|uniref:Uncharacterized protein n=1 Tax=Corchorus capsularis TaxID=210143 RepID=A0A1R3IG41_COCAP|nr:hypothetical protein CCACVL1_12359 [Corchorus capsularis]